MERRELSPRARFRGGPHQRRCSGRTNAIRVGAAARAGDRPCTASAKSVACHQRTGSPVRIDAVRWLWHHQQSISIDLSQRRPDESLQTARLCETVGLRRYRHDEASRRGGEAEAHLDHWCGGRSVVRGPPFHGTICRGVRSATSADGTANGGELPQEPSRRPTVTPHLHRRTALA